MSETDSSKCSTISFTKMHGIGNDYVYINCLDSIQEDLPELSRMMSDRHKGVGSDGIILILPSEHADFRMRIFNADGSEAKMCGNGSRCVARFLIEKGLATSDTIDLETLAGIRRLTVNRDDKGKIKDVTVDMGTPTLLCREIGMTLPLESFIESHIELPVKDIDITLTAVGIGNPHGVVFLSREQFDNLQIETIGPLLEHHPIWTDRANIEFATPNPDGTIDMRVWERGSGETMACGTGACATAVAAAVTGRAPRSTVVHLRGGDLAIDWSETDGKVRMRGGATTVFEGVYTRPTIPQSTTE